MVPEGLNPWSRVAPMARPRGGGKEDASGLLTVGLHEVRDGGDEHRRDRDEDDHEDHGVDVLLDPLEGAQEVAHPGDAEGPEGGEIGRAHV